jgi:hypothetical protein
MPKSDAFNLYKDSSSFTNRERNLIEEMINKNSINTGINIKDFFNKPRRDDRRA